MNPAEGEVLIVTHTVPQALGPVPVSTSCPSCHAQITTSVQTEATTKTHLFALLLCLFGNVRIESPLNNFQNQTDAASPSNPTEEPVPSTSKEPGPSTLKKSLLEEIRPFPKIDSCERPRKTRRVESKSRIYTDTPELNLKQNLEKDKERKENVSKKKAVVKKVFQQEYSSSDLSESSFVADDTSDEESFESLKTPQRDAKFNINDFVLVKFRKNNKRDGYCYYIGKIILVEEKVLTATFLRRRGLTTNFNFPTIPDVSVIPIEDVTAKLSAPNKIGNARVLASLRFNYNFQGYDLR
ncbi:unnamed protein product [Phaedon cochleariae]|uniref:LITAF domain-containing protein n=1 Tax=Phaedon cochleariae TaxID=80249 RepID=A0A9N9X3Z7_PHACE|nr:unnamed protein product [Phaedon cochleariae]